MSFSSGASPPDSPVSPDDFHPSFAQPPRSSFTPHVGHRAVTSFRTPSESNSAPAPLASLHASRKPPFSAGGLPKDYQDKLAAFQASRNIGPNSSSLMANQTGKPSRGGIVVGPKGGNRPVMTPSWNSAPAVSGTPSSFSKRRGPPMKLPGALLGDSSTTKDGARPPATGSIFDQYTEYVDIKTGTLKFEGKAVIHSKGVDFSSGSSFSISLDEIDKVDELGKGNYGTVFKVVHRRSKLAKGWSSNCSSPQLCPSPFPADSPGESERSFPNTMKTNGTGVVMAMKEIRLELDEAKFAQIIMELDVLHKCRSAYIVEFYGAFFQEGAVYICMEYMDGGSIDKLYKDGVPEGVLRKITYATVQGLKTLKDDHNIIHRDVKPTNILVNSNGEVKLCDFGVSGNLVASIAKTNIGCQSYMAPERIASGGMQAANTTSNGTYSVQSDIWSLGLTILECAMGCYPYPPETYNNIFSQLSAIVDGEPPDLPKEGYSAEARDFVRGCLNKIPKLRPTYAMLLHHLWIAELNKPVTIKEVDEDSPNAEVPNMNARYDKEVAEWVVDALEKRRLMVRNGKKGEPDKPALHAAPLDAVAGPENHKSPSWEEKLRQLRLSVNAVH